MKKVPFVDLKMQYYSIKESIDTAIADVIENTAFIRGKYVDNFEKAFAKECGVKHCIGVANGTDAIYLTLKMLGIGEGDEVITVANSWISTSETITQTGAKVVFVDIEPDYFTIDINKIEAKITSKTKAIIPVHFYGQMANIVAVKNIADKHNLYLIEDCAQAHFSEFQGIRAGTTGIAATFSFYPGKNLGAYGDAGAVITNDDELAKKIKMYANHGCVVKHQHEIEGINSRLDGIQAAILEAKLPHIYEWNNKRLANGLFYNSLLSDCKNIIIPKIRDNSKHIFHVYCLRAENRDGLQKFLNESNIETSIHYPTALPNMQAYKYLNHTPSDFPIASDYQSKILSLPMYPELTKEQMEYVASKIKEFYL